MARKRLISKQKNNIHTFFKPNGNVSTNVASLSEVEPESFSEVVPVEAELNAEVLQVEANEEPIEVEPDEDCEQRPSKIQRLEPKEVEANGSFERDPGLHALIYKYPVNQQHQVRQAYLTMGPYRPILKTFPATRDGKQYRRFKSEWYDQFSWLEYSPATDSAFCFPCSLFETSPPKYKTFTIDGFKSWKRVNGSNCSLLQHVGAINSTHMKAVGQCNDLKRSTHHIDNVLNTQSKDEILKWRLRLKVSIECLRLIALQGLAFRGHDESITSENRGNFLEFLSFQGKMNDKIGDVILQNAPNNAKYTSPRIQKELLNLLAERVRNKVREEVGDAKYCILVDESQDSSIKEQMALVLRFVDRGGLVRERFFKVVGVANTNALTLKNAICNVLSHYNLQVDNMRGQGYDGASNMRGAWNGLQALFIQECPFAYYVHCFAHRLQLALVASCKDEPEIWKFFSKLGTIVNLVVASSKRQSELQGAYADEIEELLLLGELDTGKGANQMCTLQRPGATRWSSHYGVVCRLIDMFGSTITVLKSIMENGSSSTMRAESKGAYKAVKSFKFALILHLAQKTMGITDVLCQALQKKSQDIVNAMGLVTTTKKLLQELRDVGWNVFLETVVSFCKTYGIVVPDLDAPHKMGTGRFCHQRDKIPFTVAHHYRISLFTSLIDFQLMELSTRFTEEAMELLVLTSSLDPRNGYKAFNIDKICTLATKYYSIDFTTQELNGLRGELQHYRLDVPSDMRFKNMTTISELCRGIVESGKSNVYPLIERLIRLVLTLPVSTATTERAFSAMKLIKSHLRTKINDESLADCMVLYIEREFTKSIDVESVVDDFDVKERRGKFH